MLNINASENINYQCSLCDGDLGILGIMGQYVYLQCRHCGMNFIEDKYDAYGRSRLDIETD